MELDEDLVSIHAYLCADGYVIKNPITQKHKYYRVGFRNTNLVLLKDFQTKFERYFRIKPRLVEGQRCEIGSKELYEKLTERFGSFYSYEWKMPPLNEDLSKIWLRSFFDCESWVFCKSHQNRHVSLECVNKIGIEQLAKSLKKLGINCLVKLKNNRKIYQLNIYGKENIILFKNKINFLHPIKKEKLSQTIKDFVTYDWNFPEDDKELKIYITNILINKCKVHTSTKTMRIISNKEINLTRLARELRKLFDIESRLNTYKNGLGTTYYQLDINKEEEIRKLLSNGLLSNTEELKWLKLIK